MSRPAGVMIAVVAALLASTAMAQTTQPATRAGQQSAEETLRQMLESSPQTAQPLRPAPDQTPQTDATSGQGAVAPEAPAVPLMREGTLLLDRIGRLTRTRDGLLEFTLEADGSALSDPPLILLPNRRLSQLEDAVRISQRDVKVRVSGEVTEYRGRNYLLLQRWAQVPDVVQPLQ